MYKRFILICIMITAVTAALISVGLSALHMHQKTLNTERQNQFISVAEQIRLDIKRTLDDFIQAEQKRPYTDYLPVYAPETTNEADAFVRSPLADTLTNGLAYGYFQIDSSAALTLPFEPQQPDLQSEFFTYNTVLETQLMPALGGREFLQSQRVQFDLGREGWDNTLSSYLATRSNAPRPDVFRERQPDRADMTAPGARQLQEQEQEDLPQAQSAQAQQQRQIAQQAPDRAGRYRIESLDESAQPVQIVTQQRKTTDLNIPAQALPDKQDALKKTVHKSEQGALSKAPVAPEPSAKMPKGIAATNKEKAASPSNGGMMMDTMMGGGMGGMMDRPSAEAEGKSPELSDSEPHVVQTPVQIRIEPFVSLLVPYSDGKDGLFSGQIFLLRHIQIEQTHLIQGFRLNQSELAAHIQNSAERFLRQGMGFELSRREHPDAAYTAILDFGFGEIGLHLLELEPGWIPNRIALLRQWFYAIVVVVLLVITLTMLSLYRSLNEQVRLSKKKDDFISAVSHELRTPLTSIRMYTEMLEKDWVKDETKRREYYGTMRQESERLTRLIENVLDFSRIQRGRKQFDFTIGDVNSSIRDVIEMMRPCADQTGFKIETEFSPIAPFAFDRDAVMQIVINLIDNSLKYAKEAQDKRIVVRTHQENRYVVIEVEDYGPGVPKSQQKKIFEAFYRCCDESTRQTTGTGLGLALVKRFVLAHHGVVEVLNTKPSGVIFRIRLAR
jgi:signal transduction histidine kinase